MSIILEHFSYSLVATVLALSISYISQLSNRSSFKSRNCSSNIISKIFEFFEEKFNAFIYLFRGADIIDEAYLRSNGEPFVIYTPGKKNIMVTSPRHIRELNNAPNHVLSLHAVAKDFLQPKYTMHGFVWNNQRGVEGVGFVRAIRTLLTSHLPKVLGNLKSSISDQFQKELNKCRVVNGYFPAPVLPIAEKLVTKCNSSVFFGPELSNNEEFLNAALSFPKDCFIAAEILRILPASIAPFVAKIVTRNFRSSTTVHRFIIDVVRQRLNQHEFSGIEKASDGIQWLIDTSPQRENWTAERLTGEIMAVWYGSVHTLSIATSYALLDLYAHPECIEPLRKEIESPLFAEFERTSNGLPLLDSFLKESARLSAFETTGIRREALQTFTFSDGLTISPGDWICVPHRSMMRDFTNFSNPLTFDAFRFVQDHESAATPPKNKLTDSSDSWLVWGSGRILCPGRFYATVVLKLVVAHLITEYDVILESTAQRSMQWRSAIIPKASACLLVKPKVKVGASL